MFNQGITIMEDKKFKKVFSALYIIWYVCGVVLLLLFVTHKVSFTMMSLEWWQIPFLPIVAPLMFCFVAAEVPEAVPMFVWGALAALGLFVLYLAVRNLLR